MGTGTTYTRYGSVQIPSTKCSSLHSKLGKLPDKDITEMVFFPVVNEAFRVYAGGIAVKTSDMDIDGVTTLQILLHLLIKIIFYFNFNFSFEYQHVFCTGEGLC
ncbi:putative isomerase, Enoyl-CoA hydratase, 3-hydroxyacyl-CoA dehydrogenase [Helianthus annuus]|nr:putative isomerase, Enoyl-CoA hydratase, 3-hydroxyacyl-CoA dehydrogenase [Helianthus annuus]